MFESFEAAQVRHRAAYFRSRFEMVDPGVPVAPADSPEVVAALRTATNACLSIVVEKIPVLFEFTEVSKLKAGWSQIERDVRQEMSKHIMGNLGLPESRAEFLAVEVLQRGSQLYGLASDRPPQVVDFDEVVGQRAVRDFGRWTSKAASSDDTSRAMDESKAVCERFGFASLRLAGEDKMSLRERSRAMKRAGEDLGRACKTMGIADRDFGGGDLAMCIDPHMPQLMGGAGFHRTLGTSGTEIGFCPNQPRVSSILIHEFTHKLDASLGAKAAAVFNEKTGFKGPIYPDERQLFSNLSKEKQAILPMAKSGLEEIFSTLGTTGRKAANPDVDLDSAAHFLVAKAMGVSRLVNAPAPQMKGWIEAVRADDDSLLRGLASKVTRMPVVALVHQFFEDHQALHGKEHPFVDALKKEGIDPKSEPVHKAFNQLHPDVVKLAVALHPALPDGMEPSPFLKASVKASVQMAKGSMWERRDLLSTPHEILARLVGRPGSMREMSTAFVDPASDSPMGSEALKRLNAGFLKMAQADGIKATANGPRLSAGFELTVARTVTPVFKAVRHAIYATMYLTGSVRSSPHRHAKNDV